jgi:hypothetical protein
MLTHHLSCQAQGRLAGRPLGAVVLTASLYLCCDNIEIVRFVFKEVENYGMVGD